MKKRFIIFNLLVAVMFVSLGLRAQENVCSSLFELPLNKPKLSVFKRLVNRIKSGENKAINLTGHEVKIHVSGESELLAKVNAIRGAAPGSHIRLGYFIIDSDYSSSLLINAMVHRPDVKFDILIDYMMAQTKIKLLKRLDMYEHISVNLFRPSDPLLNFLYDSPVVEKPIDFVRGLSIQNKDMMIGSLYKPVQKYLAKAMQSVHSHSPREKGLNEQDIITFMASLQMMMMELKASGAQGDVKITKRRIMKLMVQIEKYTRRMHHKIFTVTDLKGESLYLLNGGRNISDEYNLSNGAAELADRNYPFSDFGISYRVKEARDIKAIEKSFDSMFSGRHSASVKLDPLNRDKLTFKEIATIDSEIIKKSSYINLKRQELVYRVEEIDIPGKPKISYLENRGEKSKKLKHLSQQIMTTMREYDGSDPIEIVSAYFFMNRDFVETIKDVVRAGKTVKVFTNSAKTTDLSIVNGSMYTLYSTVMKEISDAGSKSGGQLLIYEVQLPAGQEKGSLHAKVYIIGKTVFITSANFDPRNYLLDTNNGSAIDLSRNHQTLQQIREALKIDDKQSSEAWYELNQELVDLMLPFVPNHLKRTLKKDWQMDEDNHALATQL